MTSAACIQEWLDDKPQELELVNSTAVLEFSPPCHPEGDAAAAFPVFPSIIK